MRRPRKSALREKSQSPFVNDLGKHLHNRVSDCFLQTISLCHGDPESQFAIATFGLGAAIGSCAGAYAAMIGADPNETDPLDLAVEIITMLKEAKRP